MKNKIKNEQGFFFLSSEQEKNVVIGPSDIELNNNSKENCLKKNQSFIKCSIKKLKLISISKNQVMSIGTGLIPFLEHNDANRALMGSNMQRQALALKKKELPLIETGIEKQIIKSSQTTKIAKKSGFIKYKSNKKIIIQVIDNDIKWNNNFSSNKKKKKVIKTKKLNCKKQEYFFKKTRKSNQNNYITQKTIINNKEWVKKGQTIIEGSASLNGKLSLGKNLLIGYISWEGYNFEDAIIINEQLKENDLFTSIHSKKYKTYISKNENENV